MDARLQGNVTRYGSAGPSNHAQDCSRWRLDGDRGSQVRKDLLVQRQDTENLRH
jgi:hypothetical protein